MSNKDTFNAIDVVKHYCHETDLQPPEITILKYLKDRLSNMKMLDIGVGAGRTTPYFANLVKEYVGVDYAEEMVAVCKERFLEYSGNVAFKTCDVRSMKVFEKNTFDFILFSFNGLDYISHEDRRKALMEIQRVGKSGGYFCFSTHNTGCIHKLFEFKYQFSFHPRRTFRHIVRWFLLKLVYNKSIDIKKLKDSPFVMFKDGSRNFRLNVYYTSTLEQIKQLDDFFKEIRVYSYRSGREIRDENELKSIDDPWLYYLCVIK